MSEFLVDGNVIDGRAVAAGVRERVAREVAELVAGGGPQPGLATVLVGDDPASQVYVRNKTKAAEWLGISRQTLRTKLKEYRIESAGGHDG